MLQCHSHDDVIKGKHLPRYWPFVRGIRWSAVKFAISIKISWWHHQMETFFASLALCAWNSPVPLNSPYSGQWGGALVFSVVCVWINDWVNNREAGDLRRHRGHHNVNVMIIANVKWAKWSTVNVLVLLIATFMSSKTFREWLVNGW